jgi:carbonic anhydrase/acetyltransferase-like protein (isoleucine patch superfamily)
MIKAFKGQQPAIHDTCFIAESADIIGKVELGAHSNVWYGVAMRGDSDKITVGENTNIQDNTVIHVDHGVPTTIGNNVTIGHAAIVHGCTIHDNVLVGMGAIILNGAVIEENVIIGAGAMVTSGKVIPSGSLVVGAPAKVIKTLTEEQIESIKQSAAHYVELAEESI